MGSRKLLILRLVQHRTLLNLSPKLSPSLFTSFVTATHSFCSLSAHSVLRSVQDSHNANCSSNIRLWNPWRGVKLSSRDMPTCNLLPSCLPLHNSLAKANYQFQRIHTTCTYEKDVENSHFNKTNSDDLAQSERNIESLIETWFYEVCPYGSLEAVLPFRTVIKPLNPENHPDMNKVIISLHFDTENGKEIPDGRQLSQLSDLYDLKVVFDEDKANMKITCDVIKGVRLPLLCTLQVPLKFDLTLQLYDNQEVCVTGMESNRIIIESEQGDCHLHKIKCGSISVLCRSGNITSKSTLLGNIYFHTGKSGGITADKLQGSNITCETEMGSVFVRSLYADNAVFRSEAGSIHLGHCHGQLYMQAGKSNFRIESLDGDLDIGLQSGSVDAYLSRHHNANIEVRTGDISLSFPEGSSTDLNLDCRAIMVDENLGVNFWETAQPHHKEGHIGDKGKAFVNARTLSGTIYLNLLNWIETTKLKFQTTEET